MNNRWINKLILAIFVAVVLLSGSSVIANDLGEIDPSLGVFTKIALTCKYPIKRTDGTSLAINEIAKVNFYVEKNGVGGYVPAGSNDAECKQVYDLTIIADGSYVYTVTAVDTDGRESAHSAAVVSMVVKRLPPTQAPKNLNGSLS